MGVFIIETELTKKELENLIDSEVEWTPREHYIIIQIK
jgi:hypothetical protein